MSDEDRPSPFGPEDFFGPDDLPALRKLQGLARKLQSVGAAKAPSTPESRAQVLTFKSMADICEKIADAVEVRRLLTHGVDE